MSRVSATQKVPVRSAFGAFLSDFQSDLEWNSRGREQTLVRASQRHVPQLTVDQIYNHRRVQGRFGVSDFYSRKIDSPDWSNYRPPLKRPTPDNVDSTQDIDPISPPAHDLAACLQSVDSRADPCGSCTPPVNRMSANPSLLAHAWQKTDRAYGCPETSVSVCWHLRLIAIAIGSPVTIIQTETPAMTRRPIRKLESEYILSINFWS